MLASHQPLNQVQQIVVTSSHAGQRIDNFLFTFLRGVPKSRLYRIIRKGEVRVNKGRVSANYRLNNGDTIRIPPLRFAPKEAPIHLPSNKLSRLLESSICYEDDHLLILNKPTGLAVHGGSGISLGLIEALRAMRPDAPFLELVHRLDRDTSGCVMIAKKRSMLVHLHECLKIGNIEKIYFAITCKKWHGGKNVEAPLLKFLLPSGERMVKVDTTGKFAKTGFKILKSQNNATLLQAIPLTGRTHQIRVHCAFMGHPIVGDQKYGDKQQNLKAKEQGFDRLFLHAHQLVIKIPYEPFTLTITSPMPKDFENYLQNSETNK